MKVFHFDPQTGKRGAFIENSPLACQLSNPNGVRCNLPRQAGSEWHVATEAKDRQGQPITYDYPVCFSVGQLSAGEDTAWHWYALLPEQGTVPKG